MGIDGLHKKILDGRKEGTLNLTQDHIKFAQPKDFTNVMQRKLGRDYGSE